MDRFSQFGLTELGDFLRKAFEHNILDDAIIDSEHAETGNGIEHVLTDNYEEYYKTEDGVHEDTITITFREKKTINYLVMKENIRMSQRIEKFSVLDDQDQVIYRGTIVGYKKIIPLNGMETARIRIQIEESRVCPTLSFIGVYC